MKKLFPLFTVFVFAFNIYAATLIFKVKKQITTDEFTELAIVETWKYKQIRVNVKTDYAATCRVNIYALEDGETSFITSAEDKRLDQSFLIDTPPAKIKLEVKGKCHYSVFVWGVREM